jgi:cellulose synthase/poly-beta-1,6-N-acetylglucosamine synthase-like glycosyltransferase
MSLASLILGLQWLFLGYFIVLNGVYLALNVIALFELRRNMGRRVAETGSALAADLDLPISVVVPAYNEALTIGESIRALLQLEYPHFEIVVVNDGSRDATLDTLVKEFSLRPFPEAYRVRLAAKPVIAVYRSVLYPQLRVIDKANGGKADSVNAGINAARYPIFCVIDADSVLQRDSLRRAVQPFLDDSTTVATGGTVRIANGCRVSGGFLEEVGLPEHPLAMFQIVEYLRAFLFGRLGWSPLNALLIVSGAFGLFRKEAVVAAGGFRADTIGEDMELVVRMHRVLRAQGRPYRICYVPDPVCWTEAPEDLRTLARQRIRWQRGLIESLKLNLSLCFNPRAGTVGLLAFPFFLLFECLGPLIEVVGFLALVAAAFTGLLSLEAFALLTGLTIVLGILLSTSAFVFEQMSFHVYPRTGQTLRLFGFAVLENFGYRQLNSVWRVIGMFQHLRGKPAKWGEMKRLATWHRPG